MSDIAPGGFASILSGDSFAAQAATWTLPSFDESLRRESRPPPSAAQVESIEAAAAREGHARGLMEGRAQGIAEVRAEAVRLRALIEHLSAPLAEVDAKTEQALVALMLELARRLVQQELAADPTKVLGVVRDAIGHLTQPARAPRVRLNPDDARIVIEHLRDDPEAGDWQIVPDRQLMPGDCVVESESARVDARLDTRQAQLAQRLLGDTA